MQDFAMRHACSEMTVKGEKFETFQTISANKV